MLLAAPQYVQWSQIRERKVSLSFFIKRKMGGPFQPKKSFAAKSRGAQMTKTENHRKNKCAAADSELGVHQVSWGRGGEGVAGRGLAKRQF